MSRLRVRRLRARFALALALACAPASISAVAAAQPVVRLPAEDHYDAGQLEQLDATLSEGIQSGYYDWARPIAERIFAIRQRALGGAHPDTVKSIGKLRAIYAATGERRRLLGLLEQSATKIDASRGKDSPEAARAQYELGRTQLDLGAYPDADKALARAITILEKARGSADPVLTPMLVDAGRTAAARGDHPRAEAFYARALSIVEKTPNPRDRYAVLFARAELRESQGKLDEASHSYQEAADLAKATFGQDSAEYMESMAGPMRCYLGGFDVEILSRFAVESAERKYGSSSPRFARVLMSYALGRLRLGELGRAEPILMRVLDIRTRALGDTHPEVAASLSAIALLHQLKKDMPRAVQTRAKANALREKQLQLLLSTGTEDQRRLFMESVAPETDASIELHVQHAPGDREAARLALTTILRRKGRVLDAVSDVSRRLRGRVAKADRPLLDKLLAARSRLAESVFSATADSSSRTRVDALTKESEQLEAQLYERSPALKAEEQPVTIEDVAAALPEGTSLVEITAYTPSQWNGMGAGERRYVAYVLDRRGAITWRDLGPAKDIDVLVEPLRAGLEREADGNTPARALYTRLVAPLTQALEKSNRWLVSADGALNLVPFAALADAKGKRVLENVTVSYLTSGRDIVRRRASGKQAERGSALLVGDPTFGTPVAGAQTSSFRRKTFEPLPGTAAEVKKIGTLLPGAQVLTGTSATEAAVKGARAPAILHIATHGFFLKDTREGAGAKPGGRALVLDTAAPPDTSILRTAQPLLRSGLVFAGANSVRGDDDDGVLTALEASGLELTGTQLVVLSACESGVGEVRSGDGVYGLRRAFVDRRVGDAGDEPLEGRRRRHARSHGRVLRRAPRRGQSRRRAAERAAVALPDAEVRAPSLLGGLHPVGRPGADGAAVRAEGDARSATPGLQGLRVRRRSGERRLRRRDGGRGALLRARRLAPGSEGAPPRLARVLEREDLHDDAVGGLGARAERRGLSAGARGRLVELEPA